MIEDVYVAILTPLGGVKLKVNALVLRKKINFKYQAKIVENKPERNILFFFFFFPLDIPLDYVQGSFKKK